MWKPGSASMSMLQLSSSPYILLWINMIYWEKDKEKHSSFPTLGQKTQGGREEVGRGSSYLQKIVQWATLWTKKRPYYVDEQKIPARKEIQS